MAADMNPEEIDHRLFQYRAGSLALLISRLNGGNNKKKLP
jgi:hypothetical protein